MLSPMPMQYTTYEYLSSDVQCTCTGRGFVFLPVLTYSSSDRLILPVLKSVRQPEAGKTQADTCPQAD
jgi:hypothetical protein